MTDTAPFGLHRPPSTRNQAAQAANMLKLMCCLLLVPALAACGGGRPGYITQQQPADGITITLERPQQAQVLKDYDLFVSLIDAQGKPVDGAIVFIDIVMPAMSMGTNQPLADPLGNGQYRIKGVFTMEGDWRLTVHAKIAGQDHAATFEQPVTPAP
jgi:hypothetical protein